MGVLASALVVEAVDAPAEWGFGEAIVRGANWHKNKPRRLVGTLSLSSLTIRRLGRLWDGWGVNVTAQSRSRPWLRARAASSANGSVDSVVGLRSMYAS